MTDDMKVLFSLPPVAFPELSDCVVYDIHEYLRNLLDSFEEYYFEQIYLYQGEPRGPYDLWGNFDWEESEEENPF